MKYKEITVELVAGFKPCESRFRNFADSYPQFRGSLAQLASLDKISYDDVVWVALRVCEPAELVAWARACADSVAGLDNRFAAAAADAAAAAYAHAAAADAAAAACAHAAAAYAHAAAAAAADAAADYAADAAADYAAYAARAAHAARAAGDAASYAARDAAAVAASLNQQDLNLLLLFSILEET